MDATGFSGHESTITEPDAIGRVTTVAMVEDLKDPWAIGQGLRAPEQARAIAIPDAPVDAGATLLALPTAPIRRLGLTPFATKRVMSSAGPVEVPIFEAVRLTIQGRSCTIDVLEVPDGVPVLIGQIPLRHLDFVVDRQGRTSIGNPAHGGAHTYEMDRGVPSEWRGRAGLGGSTRGAAKNAENRGPVCFARRGMV